MDWTFKVSDFAIVFATLLGPILAVQAQGWLDARKDQRRRRLAIFNTLMQTRATPLAMNHVNALNGVPLEFQGGGKAVKEVLTAWRIYIHHFSKDTNSQPWGERRLDLLTQLLQRMGSVLDYDDLDAVQIESEAYTPMAHGQAAAENDLIRQGLVSLIKGEMSLPMTVKQMPVDHDLRDRVVGVLARLETFLDSRGQSPAVTPQVTSPVVPPETSE